MKDVRECPLGSLGEVLSRQKSLQCKCRRAGECLCSRKSKRQVWMEERGIEMRSSVWPDHVGLQHIRRYVISVKDVDS